MLVVDGEPLTDIAALERLIAAMIGGHRLVGGPGGGGASAPGGLLFDAGE
jgi:hypothetical protein